MAIPDHVFNCIGFERDEDNLGKNRKKHRVTFWECEEIFFNQPLLLAEDIKHSEKEERVYVLGKTDGGRFLFAVFKVRHQHIRVISVRDMSRKERKDYQDAEEKNSNL